MHEDASREFVDVLEQEPNQPAWAIQEMANAHFFGGNDAGALAGYDRLIADGAVEEAILTRRGLSLLRLGRSEDAEWQYRQALANYPDSETAAVGLVRAMTQQGRPEDAFFVAVTWGAEADPDSEIRAWHAHLLTLLGRYEEALAVYEGLSEQRFEHAEIARSREVARENFDSERAAGPGPRPEVVESQMTLHERGVQRAREGDLEAGLLDLRAALEASPKDPTIRRDYAIALGWAERYSEALAEFDRLLELESDQPIWARKEIAQAQLFGGRTEDALQTLDGLIADGEDGLPIRSKRGLALRWLGRPEAAAKEYRRVIQQFPAAVEGHDGLALSLADRNRLSDAIGAAEKGLAKFPGDWRIRTTLAQVLNWSGRHVRAEQTLRGLPPQYLDTEDALRHQTLAARWSNQPKKAFDLGRRYREAYPDNPDSGTLFKTLGFEYGGALRGQAEMVSDSLGYSYRGTAETFEWALSPSQRLHFGHGRRDYRDQSREARSLTWNSYTAGWSGALGRRIVADASAGSIDYAGVGRRMVGDASLSALLNDTVSVSAGIGLVPAQTLPALEQRLLGGRVWTQARFRPTPKLDATLLFAKSTFDEVSERRNLEASAFYTVSRKAGQRIRVGGRSQLLWHDRSTDLMWSPSSFRSHLGSVQLEGRLPGRLDYAAEIGTGVQNEVGERPSFPIVSTFEVAKRVKPYLWLRAQAGYSNSSVGRVSPGRDPYRFSYLNVGLDVRFGAPR